MTEPEKLDNGWQIALPLTTTMFVQTDAWYEKELVQKLFGYVVISSLKILSLMQVILSLHHIQLSMRFTTTISFDIFLHHFVFSICEFFMLNSMIYKLLDCVLLVVIVIYAIDFVLALINETKKRYAGLFGDNKQPSEK